MILKLMGRLAGRISREWTLRVGRWLGWFTFEVLRVRRSVALQNIQLSLGLERPEALRLARRAYAHLATGALEFLQLERLTVERARDVLGEPGVLALREILSQGRGMLALTLHIGNWDLLACCAAMCGMRLTVVSRDIKAGWLNRFWMARRLAAGVRILPPRGCAWQMARALRANEIVAMVLDQHHPGGIAVSFLGRPAATSDALARLARATGAPVIPVALLREAQGYRLVVGEAIPLQRTSDREQDARTNTARFSRALEEMVALAPDQWLWLHRRWKVPPCAPGSSVVGDSPAR